MLANIRFYLLPSLLIVSVLVAVPVAAQVHGVPPSVTSFGFGGSDNLAPGVRASVTSLGPNGFGNAQPFLGNCCANFFLPNGYWPYGNSVPVATRRHRHHDDDNLTYVPVAVPAYVPYPVPYAADPNDDDSVDGPDTGDGAYGANLAAAMEIASKHPVRHDSAHPARSGKRSPSPDASPDSDAAAVGGPGPGAAEKMEDPVAIQPATVLIFKDGHRSDVVNYAIVGDTLFDFAEGRARKILLADLDLGATQKANEEVGVDFKVPPKSK